jgi:hypothetical protein
MEGTRALPIPLPATERLCLGCHDGIRASQEPHPVGRTFENPRVTRPAQWPVVDGRLTCLTCHDAHPSGNPRADRPRENPSFLRGDQTGDPLAFCGQCHTDARQHGLHNPHIMLSEENRPVEAACRFCHARSLPAGEQARRTGDAALNADGISLCLSCHPRHPDWFEPGHIGAKVPPAIRAWMQSFEKHRSVALPLGGRDGDTIVCATCHNPHQEGVFPPGSPLGTGGIEPEESGQEFRGLGKELCSACHGK